MHLRGASHTARVAVAVALDYGPRLEMAVATTARRRLHGRTGFMGLSGGRDAAKDPFQVCPPSMATHTKSGGHWWAIEHHELDRRAQLYLFIIII